MAFWNKQPKQSAAPRDWRARAAMLPSMFVRDFEFATKRHAIFVTPKTIGSLPLPTGAVVCQAAAWDDYQPLARRAPTGTFAIELSLAAVAPDEDRVAAARIVFSSEPAATWELAAGASTLVATTAEGLAGYTGTLGMFMDAQGIASLQAFQAAAASPIEWWYDVQFTEGARWQHTILRPDPAQPAAAALFSTGTYEGTFVSYWGLDARGGVVTLVTDCNVIP
jgi:hypothetical protein